MGLQTEMSQVLAAELHTGSLDLLLDRREAASRAGVSVFGTGDAAASLLLSLIFTSVGSTPSRIARAVA